MKTLIRERKHIDYFSDDELINVPVGDCFVFDVECYINYFLIAFKHVESHKVVEFEMFGEDDRLNLDKLRWMLFRFLLVSFNGNSYDVAMVCKSLQNLDVVALKQVSDTIINEHMKPWQLEGALKYETPTINHIDLIEVCPLEGSLKTYMARLHAERLQDLPYPPEAVLTHVEAGNVKDYCCNNDLEGTILLLLNLHEQLKLRELMGQRYNLDLRSKSDAQIAEAVICSELRDLTGEYPQKAKVDTNLKFSYTPPEYMHFQTAQFQRMFEIVKGATFSVDNGGRPVIPKVVESISLQCGPSDFSITLGGLHSKEKSTARVPSIYEVLEDWDAESFYPRIILNNGYFPAHLGEAFLAVLDEIVERRLTAKHTKDTDNANSLKIVINGTFGKLGSPYSRFYSPQLMIHVTITGQLTLLMLIEMMYLHGVETVNGNTDGIVIKYSRDKADTVKTIISQFETLCRFKMENTRYKGYYSQSVNTYIAIKGEDDYKTKGIFNNPWASKKPDIFRFHKNPVMTITVEAVTNLIAKRIPIEKTIRECDDIRKFVVVRNVKGGGHKDGVYLGKVVRWYYAKGETSAINYVLSGNKVATSDGGKPVMDLPESFPDDIDYDRYINETMDILYDIGYLTKPTTGDLF